MRSVIAPAPILHRLHPADLPPGTEVGAWRVLALSGRGASGAVYQAVPIEQQDGAPVALKLALQSGDPRFLREAELLRRSAHPNVPRLHDHGLWAHPAGPFPFLIMDWVEGVPLYAWARERILNSRQVMWLLAPMASALAATHAAKCVHRDIKGDNFLVRSEDSRPMLLDFGAGDFFGARTLTREVLPPGTPYYRSPEALRFHWLHRHLPGAHYEPGPADDVYALGVTAYCLVTGSYPPPVLPAELLASDPSFCAPVWEPPESLVTVCPELAALIRQMLSLEPSVRGSAAQVAEALDHAAQTAGSQADQPIVRLPSGQGEVAPRTAAPGQAEQVAGPLVNPPFVERRVAVSAARKNRKGLPGSARALSPWLVASVGVLAFFVLQWVELSRPSLARSQQNRGGADAGTSGLGDGSVMVRAGVEAPAPSGDGIGAEMPKQPLPGQARPPCKRREVEINDGCWKRLDDPMPPCSEREYEWKGLCYAPVLAPSPPATSKQQ